MDGYAAFVLVSAVAFLVVAVAVGLFFSLVWYVLGRIGRVTGSGAKVDRFFETDGVHMPDEERIKDDGGFRGGIGGLPVSTTVPVHSSPGLTSP